MSNPEILTRPLNLRYIMMRRKYNLDCIFGVKVVTTQNT
ncbi:hypothetical protein [Synechococcus phage S-B43]|nr:hypothetical protein [Synechococcus phage S-B43]